MMSLTKMLELLDPARFSRTHHVVNLGKIEEIIFNDNMVILKGNHKVMISDTYKDLVKQFVF
jgi:DNA-binding LytR/AlgR family response regulator